MQENRMSKLDLEKEKSTETDSDMLQFITFRVNEQEYGVDIMSVKEIKGWVNTTILPNTPLYMRGVINLRGAIVPILDLRCRFGVGLTAATKSHVVMIVTVLERTVGILVDAVSDIITISNDDIRSIPSIDVNDHNETILKGIVNFDDHMVALLDLNHVFDQNIDIHDEMLAHLDASTVPIAQYDDAIAASA
jgi:purine-binding chemotaxis protein CheW